MPTDIVSSLIVTNLNDSLRVRGYKRFNYIWNRRRGDFTHVIELQDMHGASPDSALFTVNFGVFIATVLQVVWGKAEPKCVRDVDCVIAARIGQLMPGGLDKWWRIDPSVNLGAFVEEVTDAISVYSEKFFDRVRDLDGIRTYMLEQKANVSSYGLERINLAVIEIMLGNGANAKALLDSFEGDNVWGVRAERVNRYLQTSQTSGGVRSRS